MAEANIEGGDLERICVWLPVAVGEQIYHALLRRARFRTSLPLPPAEEQLQELANAPLPPGFMQPLEGFDDVLARFDLPPGVNGF